MDKQFHYTLHNGSNYLSMLSFKLIDVSKSGPRYQPSPFIRVGLWKDPNTYTILTVNFLEENQ